MKLIFDCNNVDFFLIFFVDNEFNPEKILLLFLLGRHKSEKFFFNIKTFCLFL
jgi:hypothetical protein